MKRETKVIIFVLAVFTVAMTLGCAYAENNDVKTFKTPTGYEWKIKESTWQKMKKQANDKYCELRNLGSITPGYSDSLNVTVTKGSETYHGIAFAVKNDKNMRCEVRGVLPGGERLNVYD